MWLKISILLLCSVYTALAQSSVKMNPFKSVFSERLRSRLEVNCTSVNPVLWTAEPSSAMQNGAVRGTTDPESGENVSTLTLVNIDKSFEGTFRCTDDKTNDEVSFQLKVFNVTTDDSVEFEYKVDTLLRCHVNDDTGNTFTYNWKKGDTPVSDIALEGKQNFISHENGSLEIVHPARHFAGVYTCVAEYQIDQETHAIEVPVPYYATPKVLPFDKSKNLVEEEKLVIECKVLGYPKPSIRWLKGDVELKNNSKHMLLAADTYDGNHMEKARLEIKSVQFSDAGEYVCQAYNDKWGNFTSSQPILVRVKDKLAALWPFLGIVAEVFILCVIIFIYERKRNKDALLDEDQDQNGSAAEKKSENVRHRGNTNNPRA